VLKRLIYLWLLLLLIGGRVGWASSPDLEGKILEYSYLETVEHPEFQRYLYRAPSGDRIGVEVVLDGSPEGEWNTGTHRLMPAPGSSPPEELLHEVMRLLRIMGDEQKALLPTQFSKLSDLSDTPVNNFPEEMIRSESSSTVTEQQQLLRQVSNPKLKNDFKSRILLNGFIFLVYGSLVWVAFAIRLSIRTKKILFSLSILGVLLLFNWQVVPYLTRPFFDDAQTQRLFIGTLPFFDIANYLYSDIRHPPLFYLVLSFFLDWSTAEWVARLPALIFGNISLVGLCFLGKEIKHQWVGVIAALLLGTHPLFLEQCGQVSDVSLFLSLIIAATIVLFRYVSTPNRITLGLLILLETGMIWSYYMGFVVLIVHLFFLVRHVSWRDYLWGLLLLAVMIKPIVMSLIKLIIGDWKFRQNVAYNPEHLWGDEDRISLLLEYVNLFSFGGFWPVTVLVLILVFVWSRKHPSHNLSVHIQLLVLGGLVLSFGAPLVRLKTYYALFAMPSLCILIAIGATCWGRWASSTLLGLIGILISDPTFAHQQITSRSFFPENGSVYAELGEHIKKKQEPKLLISDAENNYSLLLYYLVDNPEEHYSKCVNVPGAAVGCLSGTFDIQTLTRLSELKEGWKQSAVEYLHQKSSGAYWLLYNPLFKNELLMKHIDEMCIMKRDWGPVNRVTLYQCNPHPGSTE